MADFSFATVAVVAVVVGLPGVLGWVYLERMKIKHGYPVTDGWGKPMHPKKTSDETVERLNSLAAENARLRTELNDMHDRLRVLERIITDPAHRLADQINNLA
jgi:hypothetical protein